VAQTPRSIDEFACSQITHPYTLPAASVRRSLMYRGLPSVGSPPEWFCEERLAFEAVDAASRTQVTVVAGAVIFVFSQPPGGHTTVITEARMAKLLSTSTKELLATLKAEQGRMKLPAPLPASPKLAARLNVAASPMAPVQKARLAAMRAQLRAFFNE
jgi:hypothetical protein